jgi:hypothetical protein
MRANDTHLKSFRARKISISAFAQVRFTTALFPRTEPQVIDHPIGTLPIFKFILGLDQNAARSD